ncbi:hypothetical protein [Lysobacter sp. D1-1-M9]|uniref:hypothetical protein n=1 Tax=Novilysobacter longmucuonensis TaxID=3098603 RepID=UPI002FC9503F
MKPAASSSRRANWLSWLLLLLSVAGFAAIWVLVSLYTEGQQSWMAALGALDVAWMLRLGGWRPGSIRAGLALIGTGLIVVLANWGITASHLGAALGLQPWESALKLGSQHAWTLAQLANGPADVAWIVLALVLAALTAR